MSTFTKAAPNDQPRHKDIEHTPILPSDMDIDPMKKTQIKYQQHASCKHGHASSAEPVYANKQPTLPPYAQKQQEKTDWNQRLLLLQPAEMLQATIHIPLPCI